jgi:hypothetical protein
MAASETDSYLHHGRNHRNALRITHYFVRDGFVRSRHNFVQNFGRRIEAFVDVRLVFAIRRPGHAGEEQKTGTEH